MPTLVKPRSYHDYHEIHGEGIGDIVSGVANVVTYPIRVVKNKINDALDVANEALYAKYVTAERYQGEQHARVGNRSSGQPYNFVGKLIA